MNHGARKAHELLVNIRGTDATVAAESSRCNHLNIDWVFSRVSLLVVAGMGNKSKQQMRQLGQACKRTTKFAWQQEEQEEQQ